MSDELNTGTDWNQSKKLLVMWHNLWAEERAKSQNLLRALDFYTKNPEYWNKDVDEDPSQVAIKAIEEYKGGEGD